MMKNFLIGPVEDPYEAETHLQVLENVDHAFQGEHLKPHSAVAVKEELWDDISCVWNLTVSCCCLQLKFVNGGPWRQTQSEQTLYMKLRR
ncbi:uncharacterized protein LACBIDRAFT_303266 [Laccaria bicolor S238N-H82]|uniref:Predicted protein n=1 Tax=Laccaria bicolor (strain S238N-H82 / ATCC MYA-4686) TaxID=486041 RepID=B0DJ84_LACBS|nr:uncharacterized protein LACBIDRAFT_303266 [Laccaria bicolor S238N-H82]EDR05360.1 predicted protein [Laccaria bicolor S238N-H82]|eukprot:XP_001883918.1 predicted protein [Laccaria bicolor S238N-H82]